MNSLLNNILRNAPNIPKNKIKRPLSKQENLSKLFTNRKNTSDRMTKYENSQGLSTQIYTLQNDNNDMMKDDHDTAFTLPSLDFMDIPKDKTLNSFYKQTKLTLRNKSSTLRSKTLTHNILTERNIHKNPSCKRNTKSIKKTKTFNGVPPEFMEAMRLDVKNNIIKANKYIKEEKKKLIKENPNLKYYFLCQNKKKREKNEQLKRAIEYKMRNKFLNNNKKTNDYYNLNDYNIKLLLKENEQHFNINRPMIDKNKFNKKFRILKNDIEEKKSYPNIDIRMIFSKLLNDKLLVNQKLNVVKLAKNIIYKKFISSIKKSAIEFKNIKIPFKEYVIYYYKSKSISQQLFNNEYSYLINLIKKEKKEKENEKENAKDNRVSDYIDKNKMGIYIIDFFGKSVLFLAVKYNLYKTITKIVQNGCNVNVQDFKGRTALHFAALKNDLISIILLLYFLANPLIKDANGNYPLDYISKNSDDYYIIKELLIRCGIIIKLNKYRSWKEFDVCIRRGIQYYLCDILIKDKYESIFSYIDNPVIYYK